MANFNETFFVDSYVELTRIDVVDLEIGMFVSELDRPWKETNFLFQGFELKNKADIKAVQEQCMYVFIDISKQKKIALQPKTRQFIYSKEVIEKRKPAIRESCFADEIDHAEQVYSEANTVIKSFMHHITLGKGLDVMLAKEVVATLVDSIIQSPDALVWLTQLKNRDEYTSQHSMNVAILAIALGRHLNVSKMELNNLGLCGMMHDMGKMQIPLDLLNKPGKLTPEEFKIVSSHTTLGWKLLMSSSNMFGGAIDVAYTHHENLDGTGYPRGLIAEQINSYTRIVSIADMYDAITSDRGYQKGRTHLEATSIIIKNMDTHLDSTLAIKFIECLGIYPPGNMLEMTNGEVAVVLEIDPRHRLKPKIVILLDEDKQPKIPQLVDLAHMSLDKSGRPYQIKKMIRADEYKIDLEGFYRKYLLDPL